MSDIDKIEQLLDYTGCKPRRKANAWGCTVIAAGRKFYANKAGEVYKITEEKE